MNQNYFLYLSGIITESQYFGEAKDGSLKNYMFFSNIRQIKEMCEKILAQNEKEVDALLENGHDWARDHISTSKDDVEEVYNWVMHRNEKNPKGKA